MNRQASLLFGVEQKHCVEEYLWKMEVISASETCLADGLSGSQLYPSTILIYDTHSRPRKFEFPLGGRNRLLAPFPSV